MRPLLFILLLISLQAVAKDFVPDSFRVRFTQSFKSTLSGKEKKSEGTLEYLYPGQFKFEVTSPESSTFISDGKTSWYYTPPFDKNEEGEVIVRPGSGPFLPEFFDSLKSGLKSGKLFKLEKKEGHYLATFTKDFAKKIGKKETRLIFKTAQPADLAELKEMIIVGQDQTEVRLEFLTVEANPGLKAAYFHFQIPPKTRVSQ